MVTILWRPFNWHRLLATLDMRADKEVYLEEPLARTVADATYLPTISLISKRGPLVGQRRRAYNSQLCCGVPGKMPDAEMSFQFACTTEG